MINKKLLLHICCAPCVVYIFRQLARDYDITGFFYNPNIHPRSEYNFRGKELKKIARREDWPIIFSRYEKDKWDSLIIGFEREPEKGKRCDICFNMRLRKTFEYAVLNKFDIVATTLSISPHKITDQINRQGNLLAKEFGLEFLLENFKKKDGFNKTKKLSQSMGIKHQNYCGCIFSREERDRKIRRKAYRD